MGRNLFFVRGAGTRDEPLRTSAWEARLGANTEQLQSMYGICTEIIFMKYKDKVQVLTTVKDLKDFIQTLLINIMQITMKLEAT